MTQGEWDTLRSLLRKAEDGGKMNELMTVHRKEVKNAPMNRSYPPDTEEWQECEENIQQPVHPERNFTKARVKMTRARAKATMAKGTMAKARLRRVDHRVFRHRSPTCNFLLGSPVNAPTSAFESMRYQRPRMIRIRRIHPTRCQKAVR